jgi:hypothetical protein
MRTIRERSIPELSIVALTHSVPAKDDRILPEGATGTVVFSYRDGAGYEVEFKEPFHSVVTVERDDIRPL